MKQKNGKMKSRLLLLLALLLMVPVGVFAQNITVKGTVKDSQGETVIGATVVEKGNTSNGVTTNLDGQFTISVGNFLYRYGNPRSGCNCRKGFVSYTKG